MSKSKKNRTLFEKLSFKYRLIIINEDNFEQKASVRVSRFNLYALASLLSVFLVISTIALIAFTPVKYYLPGVGSLDIRSKLSSLEFQADSLNQELDKSNFWIGNFQKIVSGELDSSFYQVDSTENVDLKEINLNDVTPEEISLREEMENEEGLNVTFSSKTEEKYEVFKPLLLSKPVEGYATALFSLRDNHFGVDIVAKKNAPVQSIYTGTVILSEWNPETGYVIAVQHPNNLISFYKHNETLLKKVGNFVEKGESIALVGNTGELSTGPHLHFELWENGKVIDPMIYFDFTILN